MRVLITGAAGFIGRRLSAHLRGKYDLVLGDLQPGQEPEWRGLDVRDPAQLNAACAGVDAVIHLAIASGHEGDYEDDAFNALRYDVNVKGTGQLFQAAVRQGVRRVVYTSSVMVTWGYGRDEAVASDAPARPVGVYAVTKHLGEVIAADYHQQYGIEVVCLRIAKPVDLDDAETRGRPLRPQRIAFPDLCRAYECALTAPGIGYEVVTVVGASSRQRWDLSRAERVLGYRPEYRLEELGYTLGGWQD